MVLGRVIPSIIQGWLNDGGPGLMPFFVLLVIQSLALATADPTSHHHHGCIMVAPHPRSMLILGKYPNSRSGLVHRQPGNQLPPHDLAL